MVTFISPRPLWDGSASPFEIVRESNDWLGRSQLYQTDPWVDCCFDFSIRLLSSSRIARTRNSRFSCSALSENEWLLLMRYRRSSCWISAISRRSFSVRAAIELSSMCELYAYAAKTKRLIYTIQPEEVACKATCVSVFPQDAKKSGPRESRPQQRLELVLDSPSNR